MNLVKVTTVINERLVTTEVDRKILATDLTRSAAVAKHVGLRPGQPSNLTQTASDPISREKLATLFVIYDSLRKSKQNRLPDFP